ncbi:hypothetical protein [Lysobacter sp. HA18]
MPAAFIGSIGTDTTTLPHAPAVWIDCDGRATCDMHFFNRLDATQQADMHAEMQRVQADYNERQRRSATAGATLDAVYGPPVPTPAAPESVERLIGDIGTDLLRLSDALKAARLSRVGQQAAEPNNES